MPWKLGQTRGEGTEPNGHMIIVYCSECVLLRVLRRRTPSPRIHRHRRETLESEASLGKRSSGVCGTKVVRAYRVGTISDASEVPKLASTMSFSKLMWTMHDRPRPETAKIGQQRVPEFPPPDALEYYERKSELRLPFFGACIRSERQCWNAELTSRAWIAKCSLYSSGFCAKGGAMNLTNVKEFVRLRDATC
uniref:Uncharacterized protein n=1 Tax=Physcomitrium patens TaxID=3218 RepID=A0A7I4B067_PHYPA